MTRRAGTSTFEMARQRRKRRLWGLVLTLAAVAIAAAVILNFQALGIGVFGMLAVFVAAQWLMKVEDRHDKRVRWEEKRALKGARAEEKIGDMLAPLDDSFLVMHDVTSPYGNIDHVVISETGGVFLLETKSHGGRVSVQGGRLLLNGHDPEKDFIAQTLRNTYWLREKVNTLSGVQPWVTPILVFTNAFVERTPPVQGVQIVNKKYMVNLIRFARPGTHSAHIWKRRKAIRHALLGA